MPDVNSPPTTGAALPAVVRSSAMSRSVARICPTGVSCGAERVLDAAAPAASSTTAILSVWVPVASLRMKPEIASGSRFRRSTGVLTSRSIWLSISRALVVDQAVGEREPCRRDRRDRSISAAIRMRSLSLSGSSQRVGRRASGRCRSRAAAPAASRSSIASSVLRAARSTANSLRAIACRRPAPRHVDLDLVRLAVAIAGLGLEAEEVVARQLEREARERVVGVADDAEDRAAREPAIRSSPSCAERRVALRRRRAARARPRRTAAGRAAARRS